MKKFISLLLSVAMIFTLAAPAFAVEPLKITRPGIIGEIFYEEEVRSTSKFSKSLSENGVRTILSKTVNNDGSITIYQYEDNKLTEYHTTVPGSGIMVSTYVNNDGTQTTKETITKTPLQQETNTNSNGNNAISALSFSSTALSSTQILTPTSVRPLGYMHYNHVFTGQTYSISCEVREKYHGYEYYTFNQGAADTLSHWTTLIISAFAFHKMVAEKLAIKIFNGLLAYNIIGTLVDNIYQVLLTKTLACYWYDQEIHGTPMNPVGKGSECYLPGVYAYVDYGNGLEVTAEGYTVADWRNPTMGRWMMYNVFNIDERPDTWIDIGN